MSGRSSPRSTPTTSPASRPPVAADRDRSQEAPSYLQLLLLSVSAAIGVIVVYLVAIRTGWGQEIDEKTLLGNGVISDVRADQADRFLRIVSVGTLTLATTLVAAVAFLRGRPRMAIIAAASIAVALLSTELLKLVILERPPLTRTFLNEGQNSYPSGHTTIGMSVCVAAMLVVPPRLRMVTALGAGAVAAAFGVAVVAASWHRPSDAIGAYLVCIAIGALAAALIEAYPDERARADRRARPARTSFDAPELALIGLGLALLAVFGVAALGARGIPLFSAGAGFLIASATLAAAAFLSTIVLALTMNASESSAGRA